MFSDIEAPGLSQQPIFVRSRLFGELDFASPVENPRTGGRYLVAFDYFADTEFNRYSFERWEIDARQYLSFLRGRRVLAFRGLALFSDPNFGHTVPFYLQQWLVPLIFDFFKKSLVIWGHRGLERCAVRTASPSRGSRRLFSST